MLERGLYIRIYDSIFIKKKAVWLTKGHTFNLNNNNHVLFKSLVNVAGEDENK